MLSLASPDAWHVSGRTCTVVQRPCSHPRRPPDPIGREARRPRERRFAVRASTGSPAARERGSVGGTDHAVTVIDRSPPTPRARRLAPTWVAET